ncbi:MAG TPA: hypothetical protein H9870_04405 [Candidatus Corynebacterium avicola]|uniref:Uncharacterized protein n=1 Tax=Candidatus Corynebacterium avicola TaxID=2838527 RepID=A0A9D1RNM4_9CORY|nr:hypothetical protein [Candidatus Corynebacterium avicola]
MPDHGHPSSLWGQPVHEPLDPHRPYRLPEDFGIAGTLAQEILDWTSYFQRNFDKLNDDPDGRPTWKDGADVQGWHTSGDAIVERLASGLPDHEIDEGFTRYVRSTNENRALAGLPRFEVPKRAITPTNPPAPDDEGVVVLDLWDGS